VQYDAKMLYERYVKGICEDPLIRAIHYQAVVGTIRSDELYCGQGRQAPIDSIPYEYPDHDYLIILKEVKWRELPELGICLPPSLI
jgi:hypothetical protein